MNALSQARYHYGLITGGYWGFTLTDGALRMMVLLYFHTLGYSPFTLALLFLLYEAAGIFANLAGGWLATRFGIRRMLLLGISTQILGLGLLSLLNPLWTAALSVVWVVIAQGLCGIAKDLTKTASKSAIKVVQQQPTAHATPAISTPTTPEGSISRSTPPMAAAYSIPEESTSRSTPPSRIEPATGEVDLEVDPPVASPTKTNDNPLLRWVAWFTGSKNAMKGLGFFLGGLLLQSLGFQGALWLMMGLLLAIGIILATQLPPDLGRGLSSKTLRELLAKTPAINLLAAARILLFGARDVWFVVGVPVYLYAAGWSFTSVGLFWALWTIGYGVVQAITPQFMQKSDDGLSQEVRTAQQWALYLLLVPIILAGLFIINPSIDPLWIVFGLGVFGVIFALNSSLHSYLILAYAGSKKAAEDVGFYYAANASGRFVGTLLSGLLYQWAGLSGVLLGASAMLMGCWVMTLRLPSGTGDAL